MAARTVPFALVVFHIVRERHGLANQMTMAPTIAASRRIMEGLKSHACAKTILEVPEIRFLEAGLGTEDHIRGPAQARPETPKTQKARVSATRRFRGTDRGPSSAQNHLVSEKRLSVMMRLGSHLSCFWNQPSAVYIVEDPDIAGVFRHGQHKLIFSE